MKKYLWLYRLSTIAVAVAFFVVILGAYTRLKDAGLGCPDWPGCYGNLIAPMDAPKGWIEMVHRYVASTLGVFILVLVIGSFRARKPLRIPLILLLLLPLVVIFQALLGKWTVTLRLHPVIVMSHLLGGFTLLSLLWWLRLSLKRTVLNSNPLESQLSGATKTYRVSTGFKAAWWVGCLLLIIQISLGGWVSTNYAALVCPTFPECQGKLFPPMDFNKGFQWQSIGPNYEGGNLDMGGRVTIHMTHRMFAMIVAVYLLLLSLKTVTRFRHSRFSQCANFIVIFVLIQFSLGILNVLWLLPLPIAVAHNGFAALLLLSVLTQLFLIHTTPTLGTKYER